MQYALDNINVGAMLVLLAYISHIRQVQKVPGLESQYIESSSTKKPQKPFFAHRAREFNGRRGREGRNMGGGVVYHTCHEVAVFSEATDTMSQLVAFRILSYRSSSADDVCFRRDSISRKDNTVSVPTKYPLPQIVKTVSRMSSVLQSFQHLSQRNFLGGKWNKETCIRYVVMNSNISKEGERKALPVSKHHTIKHMGRGLIAPRTINLGSRWR
jgi:hypothetical protein